MLLVIATLKSFPASYLSNFLLQYLKSIVSCLDYYNKVLIILPDSISTHPLFILHKTASVIFFLNETVTILSKVFNGIPLHLTKLKLNIGL